MKERIDAHCRCSDTDMRKAMALAVAALVAVPGHGNAQAPDRAQAQVERGAAKRKIQAQGDDAMERVRRAIEARKPGADAPMPALPANPDAVTSRRAFDALRTRGKTPDIDQRARTALEQGRRDVANDRDAMVRRLNQAFGIEAPETAALARAALPATPPGCVPVLFVSSSMPIATLRTYAAQLEKARGVMALRGMPGGLSKIAPLAKLSAQILRLDPGCDGPACAMRDVQLIVDPIVFRQHGVARVPALAMIPSNPTLPYCEREDESPRSAHLVLGDAALSGMVEEFARLGGKEEVRDAQARLEIR
ncbi:type-F conjugative transfer system pilin assembly protein TrbC [Novosphingobium sp. AP12]|uniref:type-F conjugative transfer system pilin assembly protein TrbC n=1 Tax=Novosphingobium sp. AP12 TaxID=1144305 RepID=UPI0035109647